MSRNASPTAGRDRFFHSFRMSFFPFGNHGMNGERTLPSISYCPASRMNWNPEVLHSFVRANPLAYVAEYDARIRPVFFAMWDRLPVRFRTACSTHWHDLGADSRKVLRGMGRARAQRRSRLNSGSLSHSLRGRRAWFIPDRAVCAIEKKAFFGRGAP